MQALEWLRDSEVKVICSGRSQRGACPWGFLPEYSGDIAASWVVVNLHDLECEP